MKLLLMNADLFDGKNNFIQKDMNILIDGNVIKKIYKNSQKNKSNIDKIIDLKGITLMPGLIDAHVHLTAAKINPNQRDLPASYINGKATVFAKKMLYRGFTSVRDAGGCDYGIKMLIEDNSIEGPRLFLSCKALSVTGGHGDFRHKESGIYGESIHSESSVSVLCDGEYEVRKLTREQLRKGASQIKILASVGIDSPSDNVSDSQFTEGEISAIVDEANQHATYVMAHAYSPESIKRCIINGVRCIEHGNLINNETAGMMKQFNAYLVPTLSVYNAFFEHGDKFGLAKHTSTKLNDVLTHGLNALTIAKKHGVKIGFGTDLLGEVENYQCDEFTIRGKVETPFEILHSATYINAEILNMQHKLGIIAENALADIIVVGGNPLEDITLFTDTGRYIQLIIKNGNIIKNEL
ncbi:MAG TPA: amidohydrolase family protein [Victivallales bacterium]|nr:amidohydrolase family protein [Victivallales bacterium]